MDRQLADRVEDVLDGVVRPWLAQHAGDIRVDGMDDDGVLRVRLSGRCAGCPTANLEVTGFVADELRARLPEVRDVVAVSGVSDALLAQARTLLALHATGIHAARPGRRAGVRTTAT